MRILSWGGYPNLIPLDETIDAVYAVGLAMPSELRCTSKGGLAVTPSAQALQPGCCGSGCPDAVRPEESWQSFASLTAVIVPVAIPLKLL